MHGQMASDDLRGRRRSECHSVRQVVSLVMLLGINWTSHFGTLGSAEGPKESLRQISPISPSGRCWRGKAIHSSCISKSAAETNRMVPRCNNGDPTGNNIGMECANRKSHTTTPSSVRTSA